MIWKSVKLFSVLCRRSFATAKNAEIDALAGVTVLDFTRIIAGPYCTMMLGDLGAKVIKLEDPNGGDESRKWGPPFIPNCDDSYYFLAINRNKMSICVDMKSKTGKEVIYDLVKKSDVFVENFLPGKLDKVGLGYGDLSKISPGLIYCSITGFGPKGPYADRPGYDVIAAGMAGLLSVTGEMNGGPVKVGVPVTDLATGLNAFGAILAALLVKEKTGRGQKIDCDLLSTQIAGMINIASVYLNAGVVPKKWGTAHVSIVPYQAFPTADGHLLVGAGSEKQFEALCHLIGAPHLSRDNKFTSNSKRVENRDELLKTLTDIFGTKTTKQWQEILKGAPFPNGPINTIAEVFEDEHVKAIEIVKELEHGSGKSVKMVGPAVQYGACKNEVRIAPPTLGQHTTEILSNLLNYDSDKIQYLKENKVDVPVQRMAVLKLRKPKNDKKVVWTTDTVDNEDMNKKKSKCCCIYRKKVPFGESDSENSDDECVNCTGHVEKKKEKHAHKSQTAEADSVTQTIEVTPMEVDGETHDKHPDHLHHN